MHLYWRLIEELKFMGETIIFHDPSLLRYYKLWIDEHADAIALSNMDVKETRIPIIDYRGAKISMN